MKPIINFFLRSAVITLNQDLIYFNDEISIERFELFIKTLSRKNKNDKK